MLNKLEKFEIDGETVFCRKDDGDLDLQYGCGFRIKDDAVSWSVSFKKDSIDHAAQIKASVTEILRNYREAANAQ